MSIKNFLLYCVLFFSMVSCQDGGQDDERAKAFNEQGTIYYNENNTDEAIISYKKAIDLKDVSNVIKVNVIRNLSQAFIQKSEIDSAIVYLQLASALSKSDSYNFHINNADRLLLLDSTYQALLHLEKADKMATDDISASNMLGLIYLGEYGVEFRNAGKALAYNKKAYAANKDKNTGYVLALNYFKLERYAEAQTLLKDLTIRFPKDASSYFLLGKTRYHLNDSITATLDFEKAISIDKDYETMVSDFKEEFIATDTPIEEFVNEK